jgi:hypothetical protein
MPDEIPHSVKKSLIGSLAVSYACPMCSCNLENPLSEAGKKDTCPNCGTGLIVPGLSYQEEKARLKEQAKREEELKARQHKERAAKRKAAEMAANEARIQAEMAENEARRQAETDRLNERHLGYVYRVEQFNSNFANCHNNLTTFINRWSEEGWEYVDFVEVRFWQPAGCLAAFLGNPGSPITAHLVTFRRVVARDSSGNVVPFR